MFCPASRAAYRILGAIIVVSHTRRVSPLDSFSVLPAVVRFQEHCSALLFGTLPERYTRRAQLLRALAQS